jgi:flagellin
MYGYVGVDPSCESLSDIVVKINQGSQASGTLSFSASASSLSLDGREITLNGRIYKFDQSQPFSTAAFSDTGVMTIIGLAGMGSTVSNAAERLAVMLYSHYSTSGVFAAVNGSTLQLFATQFGSDGNEIGLTSDSQEIIASDTHLKGGGETPLKASLWWNEQQQEYELQLSMEKGGDRYQMRIFALTSVSGGGKVIGDPLSKVGYWGTLPLSLDGVETIANYGSTDNDYEWVEAQNGSGRTNWDGADILTQDAAQRALLALDQAVVTKDMRRTELGAYANRLENTITNLQMQAENLQYAESRISDVDVASEMVEYSRDQILVQAGVAMLSQANSFPKIALELLKF